MSKDEIKYEINQVLDKLSNDSLQELLLFLRQLETKTTSLTASDALQKILLEDKELLQKLAQ